MKIVIIFQLETGEVKWQNFLSAWGRFVFTDIVYVYTTGNSIY